MSTSKVYQSGPNVSLLDTVLECAANEWTVQLRVDTAEGRTEYHVGRVTGASYTQRSPQSTEPAMIDVHFGHTTVRVPLHLYDGGWTIYVPQPDADALYIPEVIAEPDPKLAEEIEATGADNTPFCTIRSVDTGGYLLNWPEWGPHPGKTVFLGDAQPEYRALSNALEFIGGDWEEADADRVEFIGTDEAQEKLAARLGSAHRIPFLTNRIGMWVMALRWENGKPVAWEEASIAHRTSIDTFIVKFRDGHEAGAMLQEIQATEDMWTRIHRIPIQ